MLIIAESGLFRDFRRSSAVFEQSSRAFDALRIERIQKGLPRTLLKSAAQVTGGNHHLVSQFLDGELRIAGSHNPAQRRFDVFIRIRKSLEQFFRRKRAGRFELFLGLLRFPNARQQLRPPLYIQRLEQIIAFCA